MEELPAARLQRFIDEGRLVREEWGDGRETACLLAAMAPGVTELGVVAGCPARLMPLWFANLTIDIDDNGTEERWPIVVRRYAQLAQSFNKFDDAAWERARHRILADTLAEARRWLPESEAGARELLNEAIAWLRGGAPPAGRRTLRNSWDASVLCRQRDPGAAPVEGYASALYAYCSAVWDELDDNHVSGVASSACTAIWRAQGGWRGDRWKVWDVLIDIILDAVEVEVRALEAAS